MRGDYYEQTAAERDSPEGELGSLSGELWDPVKRVEKSAGEEGEIDSDVGRRGCGSGRGRGGRCGRTVVPPGGDYVLVTAVDDDDIPYEVALLLRGEFQPNPRPVVSDVVSWKSPAPGDISTFE